MLVKKYFLLLKQLTLLWVLTLTVSGCSGDELTPGVRASVTVGGENNQVIEQMRDRGIPLEIRYSGGREVAVYNAENMAEVLSITRTVRFGDTLDPNYIESLILRDQEQKEQFEAAFQTHRIKYFVSNDFNRIEIHWSQLDGPKVDEIRQYLYI
ncbi:hypothetical protein CWE08_12110, partial [Aliidiomarina iranensis]